VGGGVQDGAYKQEIKFIIIRSRSLAKQYRGALRKGPRDKGGTRFRPSSTFQRITTQPKGTTRGERAQGKQPAGIGGSEGPEDKAFDGNEQTRLVTDCGVGWGDW